LWVFSGFVCVFYEAGYKFSSVNYSPIFALKKNYGFFLGEKKKKHPNFPILHN
jgi:hypothetical protein